MVYFTYVQLPVHNKFFVESHSLLFEHDAPKDFLFTLKKHKECLNFSKNIFLQVTYHKNLMMKKRIELKNNYKQQEHKKLNFLFFLRKKNYLHVWEIQDKPIELSHSALDVHCAPFDFLFALIIIVKIFIAKIFIIFEIYCIYYLLKSIDLKDILKK